MVFALTLLQIRDLMELRGSELSEKIQSLGGVMKICEMLQTSPTSGETSTRDCKFLTLQFFILRKD